MRMMSKWMQMGGLVTCASLLPWLACAQAANEEKAAAAPKAEVKKGLPAGLFGKNAKPADKDAPPRETVITADKIDFDNKNNYILFDGNVLVDDAQFTMRSEQLMVFTEGTDDVSQIMAIGNVKITNDLRDATCDKAVYTKADAKIVMTAKDGNIVHLETRGEKAGMVEGAGVVIWLDDERVQIFKEGNAQPRIVIPGLGAFKDAEEKKPPKPNE